MCQRLWGTSVVSQDSLKKKNLSTELTPSPYFTPSGKHSQSLPTSNDPWLPEIGEVLVLIEGDPPGSP